MSSEPLGGLRADGVAADGATVGPYRLVGRLGAGGMGEVYRAFDRRLDRWVALKRLRSDRRVDGRYRQRFRQEAKAAASLSHAGIVQVHDVLDERGETWIVMELVEGRALSELPAPLAVDRCLELGAQVAEALAAAHARGIVHRDLKAENVLLTDSGRIKITDFGLAKRLEHGDRSSADALSATGQVLGTVRAMSPEQSRGLRLDARSDLFALGVLLYELLTGESPFRSTDPLTTLERIRSHAQRSVSALRPSVPVAISAYVDRLLEKNPNRRPSDAAGVSEELRRLGAAVTEPDAPIEHESTLDPVLEGGWLAVDSAPTEPVAEVDRSRPTMGSFSLFRLGKSRDRRWMGIPVMIALLGALWWGLATLRSADVPAHIEPGFSGSAGVHSPGADRGGAIYVAVGEPRLYDTAAQEHEEQIQLVQAAVRTAVLKALLDLEGTVPVTADSLDIAFESDLALGKALAADEVISSRLDCRRRACALTLHRIQIEDGQVLALEDMQLLESSLFQVSRAVRARVLGLYEGFPSRSRETEPAVDPEIYFRLLELRRAFKEGSLPREQIAQDLGQSAVQAPSYPEVYLLTADVFHAIYFHSRRPEDLARALEALSTARRLSPSDPEPLYRQISLFLEAGRLAEAREALDELDALQTGDVRVAMRRALLWEREGRSREALELLRRQLEIFPAWQGLLDLAGMEYRQGQTRAARATLERLLERTPNSGRARSFLAQLELMRGDPKRAEALYRQLSEQSSSLAMTANLGLALLLQGRFEPAAEQFRRTVDAAPSNPALLLNLADAELLRGRDQEALGLYDEVARLTEGAEESTDASRWQLLTVRAQAFAHSDRSQQAAEAIQQALRDAPGHPQVAFEASLVLALIGEPASALAHAKRARRDFGPAWFRLSWFEALHDEPDFQALLLEEV